MVAFAKIKTIALAMPGVEEGTSYGTPAFKVRGKLMARLKEDSETLVLRVAWDKRERLLVLYPEAFFLTDHYHTGPWIARR